MTFNYLIVHYGRVENFSDIKCLYEKNLYFELVKNYLIVWCKLISINWFIYISVVIFGFFIVFFSCEIYHNSLSSSFQVSAASWLVEGITCGNHGQVIAGRYCGALYLRARHDCVCPYLHVVSGCLCVFGRRMCVYLTGKKVKWFSSVRNAGDDVEDVTARGDVFLEASVKPRRNIISLALQGEWLHKSKGNFDESMEQLHSSDKPTVVIVLNTWKYWKQDILVDSIANDFYGPWWSS